MKNLAHSFLTIKSINDGDRTIKGIASTPAPDRKGDIVEPMGAKFVLPIPLLWQHEHDKPIGHVTEASVSEKGIDFVAKIASTDVPGKLKELLDYAWQSIKLNLVGAVSIGFRPTEYSFIENGGIRFSEWDWFELSAVTIPAQPEAVINNIKSMNMLRAIDAGLRLATGTPEPEIPVKPSSAALGKKELRVKLDAPVRDRTAPFVAGIRR